MFVEYVMSPAYASLEKLRRRRKFGIKQLDHLNTNISPKNYQHMCMIIKLQRLTSLCGLLNADFELGLFQPSLSAGFLNLIQRAWSFSSGKIDVLTGDRFNPWIVDI